jgi:hypothetical protein
MIGLGPLVPALVCIFRSRGIRIHATGFIHKLDEAPFGVGALLPALHTLRSA